MLLDYGEALKWSRKAAEQGSAHAQHLLGALYRTGMGVEKDQKKAVKWFRMASEKGFAPAQASLAASYHWGWGVNKNYPEALKLYLKAAEQDLPHAFTGLFEMYRNGEGVAKNNEIAIKWIRRLLAHKNPAPGNDYASVVAKMLSVIEEDAHRKAKRGDPLSIALLEEIFDKSKTEYTDTNRTIINQTKERLSSLPTTNETSTADDVAVIIGNSNYDKFSKDIPNVVPAHNDAKAFKNWIVEAKGVREGNIIYLKDATSAQIISAFGDERSYKGQLFNWTKPNISNVYVYYAGHGAPAGAAGSTFLVPSDSNSATIDLTGYPLATLYKNLSALPAKSIIVVLEACFSGSSQTGNIIPNTSGIFVSPKVPRTPKNITVISAGRANQIASWERDKSHSLFTKYFLKGMDGEADKSPYGNGDGIVNYKELGKYLDGTMTYYARRYYGRDQNAQIVTSVQ